MKYGLGKTYRIELQNECKKNYVRKYCLQIREIDKLIDRHTRIPACGFTINILA